MSTDISHGPGLEILGEREKPLMEWLKLNHIDGVDFDCAPKWSDFKLIPSDKAYEHHKGVRVDNYMIGITHENLQQTKQMFYSVLVGLKMAAFGKKLEGYAIGGGQLIIQDRMKVITEYGSEWDSEDRMWRIMWYGRIDRVEVS